MAFPYSPTAAVDPIPKLISALSLEIAEVKRRGGSQSVTITGGERRGQVEGRTLYAFPAQPDLIVRDDVPIRVVVGDNEVDGVIVSASEDTLVVALDQDLGPRIAAARLVLDESFLLERLKAKLEEVMQGRSSLNRTIADQTIGLGATHTSEIEVSNQLTAGLNAEQAECISKALGSDVVYLWGPPGTGKTTTLARVVQAYYEAGKSVLLVSNTNVAVDTALEKICHALETDIDFQQGAVLRIGPIVKPELKSRFADRIVVDEIVARLGQELQAERETYAAQAARLEADQRSVRAGLDGWERLDTIRTQRDEAVAQVAGAESDLATRERSLRNLESELERKRYDLQRSAEMGRVGRFFRGLDPDTLRREIATLGQRRQAEADALDALRRQYRRFQEKVAESQRALLEIEQAVSLGPPRQMLQEEDARLRRELSKVRNEIVRIDAELDSIRSKVLRNAKVLAATAYQAYLHADLERPFDVVVIDEASMLILPLAYYAAGRAVAHVVVAGDFRQLPPIVRCKDDQAQEWLKRDVFEKAGIPEAIAGGKRPEALVALRTQFRMQEPICGLLNEVFYPDRPLVTHGSVRERDLVSTYLGTDQLYLVDTSDLHPWCALRTGTFSRYNILHAILARNLVWSLTGLDTDVPVATYSDRVGIVAPYTAQARLLGVLIGEEICEASVPVATTVHRFQGNEKTVMVVDLTDSIGSKPGQFITSREITEDGARLLNVAFSRAREQVILLANLQYLRQRTPSDGITQQLLDYFETNAVKLDANEVLALDPNGWVAAFGNITAPVADFDPEQAGIFTEGTFFGAFMRDVLHAQESVVIFSPFVTSRGAARIADLVRHKADSGVPVRLVTRPEGDHGGILEEALAETFADLERLGVTIDRRMRLHEKVAIIDDQILWYGSLNIMSHRDTTESMFRVPSPAICRQMTDLLISPENRARSGAAAANRLADKENPECPRCESPTVWRTGRYGVYYECVERCGGKVDPSRRNNRQKSRSGPGNRSGRQTGRTRPRVTRTCPACSGELVERTGRYGRFLGCSSFPRCRHSENL